jgi:hypothetical protein
LVGEPTAVDLEGDGCISELFNAALRFTVEEPTSLALDFTDAGALYLRGLVEGTFIDATFGLIEN